jgi:hypothetical protein
MIDGYGAGDKTVGELEPPASGITIHWNVSGQPAQDEYWVAVANRYRQDILGPYQGVTAIERAHAEAATYTRSGYTVAVLGVR